MGFHVEVQHCSNCENHSWCTHHASGSYADHFREVSRELRSQFNCDVKGSASTSIGAFEIFLVQDSPPSTELVFSKLGCGRWPSPAVICDVIRDVLSGHPVPTNMTTRSRPRKLEGMGPPLSARRAEDGESGPSSQKLRLNKLSKMHLAEKKLRPLSPISHSARGSKPADTPYITTPRKPQEKPPGQQNLSPRKQSAAQRAAKKPTKQVGEEDSAIKAACSGAKEPPDKPAKSSSQRPVSKPKEPQKSAPAAPEAKPVETAPSIRADAEENSAVSAQSSSDKPKAVVVEQPNVDAKPPDTEPTPGSPSPRGKPKLGVAEKFSRVALGEDGEFEEQIGRSGGPVPEDGSSEFKSEIVVFAPGGVQGTVGNGMPLSGDESAAKKTRIKNTGDIKTLEFDDDILDISVHHDLVACAGEGGEMAVWDYKTRKKVFRHAVDWQVTCVAFSISGEYLAIADSMGKLRVFSCDPKTNTFKSIGEFTNEAVEADDVAIMSLSCSSCGNLLAFGDMEAKVMILTLPGLVVVAELTQSDDVHSLSFSLCGTYLASGSGGDRHHGLYTNKTATSDMRVVVWKMATESTDFRYMGQCIFEDVVYVTQFSPDSKWLAVGTDDACVSLLCVEKNFKKLIELAASAGIRCMCWSPDSRFLAIGGVAKMVDVWDLSAHQVTFSLPIAEDWITAVAFAPDMCNILVSSFGVALHIYPLEWENLDFKQTSAPATIAANKVMVKKMKSYADLAEDGKSKKFQRVDLGSATDAAFTVIVANEQCMRRPSLLQVPPGALVVGTPQKLESIAMNVTLPCGKSEDAHQHHRASVIMLGQLVRLRADDFPEVDEEPETFSCDDEILALSLSRDGKFLACGGWDEKLTVITTADKKVVWRQSREATVTCIAWSACGRYIACGQENGFVGLWDVDGEELGEAENFAETEADLSILCVQFSPNSKLIAWGDLDKKVTLVSVPDLEQVAELVHEGDLKSISFSATGSMLAAGGGTDRQHGLMDTKSDTAQMKTMVWSRSDVDKTWKTLGHIISPNVVTCVEFSPDEQFLAIGDDGTRLNILIPHQSFKKFIELELPGSLTCLTWTPCGCFVLVGAACRTISIFHVHSHTLIKTIPGFNDWVSSITFSPTYKLFAVAAHDEKVCIFRLREAKPAVPDVDSESGFSMSEDEQTYSMDHENVDEEGGKPEAAFTVTEDPKKQQQQQAHAPKQPAIAVAEPVKDSPKAPSDDYESDAFEDIESDEC